MARAGSTSLAKQSDEEGKAISVDIKQNRDKGRNETEKCTVNSNYNGPTKDLFIYLFLSKTDSLESMKQYGDFLHPW